MKRLAAIMVLLGMILSVFSFSFAEVVSTEDSVKIYAEALSGLNQSYSFWTSTPKYRSISFVSIAFDLNKKLELNDCLAIAVFPSWTGCNPSTQEIVYCGFLHEKSSGIKITYNTKSGYAEYVITNYSKELSETECEKIAKDIYAKDGITEYYQNPEELVFDILETLGITVTKNK